MLSASRAGRTDLASDAGGGMLRESSSYPREHARDGSFARLWWFAAAVVTVSSGCTNSELDASAPAFAFVSAPRRLDYGIDSWRYTEFSDAYCRDSSHTGVAVSVHPGATKLMIYLEQGGACFNEDSCALNPSNTFLD